MRKLSAGSLWFVVSLMGLYPLWFPLQVVCRDLLQVAALQRYTRDQGSSVYFPQAVLRGETAPRHRYGGSEGPKSVSTCVCSGPSQARTFMTSH